jgi:primosomal protein N'
MNATITYLPNSWECYTPDMVFINCGECAAKFIEEYGLDTDTQQEDQTGYGAMECLYCGHEFDYPPSCDGCHKYLDGNLTNEGIEYLKERKFPKWLRDYYLSNN